MAHSLAVRTLVPFVMRTDWLEYRFTLAFIMRMVRTLRNLRALI